jgi:carboxymethylenebutenolidase
VTQGQFIELTGQDGVTISAYRVRPVGKAKAGLVLVQEIFGVNAHIRGVADRFSAQGYDVIAPAFFDRVQKNVELGYDAESIATGRTFPPKLGFELPLVDVAAATAELSPSGKVGIVGFCWGGTIAYLAALREPRIAAAVGYYGGAIVKHADERPRVPTLLHFGEQDAGIPLSDVEAIKANQPDVTVETYPAGHGFNCEARGSYDEASAALALGRTLSFLALHLS